MRNEAYGSSLGNNLMRNKAYGSSLGNNLMRAIV
jgi:hypothetical protein